MPANHLPTVSVTLNTAMMSQKFHVNKVAELVRFSKNLKGLDPNTAGKMMKVKTNTLEMLVRYGQATRRLLLNKMKNAARPFYF